MAVLVTGGTGYIGSATVEMLCDAGEDVVVLDDLYRGHRRALPHGIPLYAGKVGDRGLVRRLLAENPIDSCIHFAALTSVGESVQHPLWYYENNGAQSIALLEELVSGGVKRMVFSSTAATYGEPQYTPVDESHPQHPENPYGWGKLLIERLLWDCDGACGLRFVGLRYFNAAGATERCGEDHQPETHLIPNVLGAALGKIDHLTLFGDSYPTPDGTPIRDYIHVADLGRAHLLALAHLRSSGESQFINLGNGQGYSVMEVIDTVRAVTGEEIPVRVSPPRAGDTSILVAQAEKARSILGWTPQFPRLDQIVTSAWTWHRQHPEGYGEDRDNPGKD